MDLMLYRTADLAPFLGEPQTGQHHLRIEHSLRAVVVPFPKITRYFLFGRALSGASQNSCGMRESRGFLTCATCKNVRQNLMHRATAYSSCGPQILGHPAADNRVRGTVAIRSCGGNSKRHVNFGKTGNFHR